MKIAIYSRKSKFTGKGESIENQIIKCKKFIDFKFSDDLIKDDNIEIYIDEGFSGKNENRPAYKDMMNKVKNKEIDRIVIYQLNRLGRNARDIHNTMQLCEDLNAVIYSATEGFDSSTSFGRAVIGILASLAQLEREQLAERVKDNMYTLAKMGRWLGGQSPLGFDGKKETYVDDKFKERSLSKLSKNNEELKIVKLLYKKYLEEKSLSQVSKWALTNNLKGKNGGNLDKNGINVILQNPVYVKSDLDVMEFLEKEGFQTCGDPNGNGILRYGKEDKIAAVAKHKGIISSKDWIKVQEILKINTEKAPRLGKTNTALLTGIIKCQCGSGMRVTYGSKNKEGIRPFYYTCSMKNNSGGTRCTSKNILGSRLEENLISYLKDYNKETLLVELKNLINKTEEIKIANEVESLDTEILQNEDSVNRLLSKLSLTDDIEVSEIIMDQIKKIKDKIKELNKQREEKLNNQADATISQKTLMEISNKISDFNDTFNLLDFDKKKEYLNDLLESVTWLSDSGEIIVDFKIDKKK